jgi:NADH:ubiquinone oxidoreductase subunit 4 (subunit M)
VFDNNVMGFPILSIIVYIPILTALVLLFLRNNDMIRRVAALGAAVDLVVSLVAFGFYA